MQVEALILQQSCGQNRKLVMGKSCCSTCNKSYHQIYNAVLLVYGIVLLILGVLVKFDESTFMLLHAVLPRHIIAQIPYGLMTLGALMIIISFTGCCGSCAESLCFFYLYIILNIILILGQIIVTIVIAATKNTLQLSMQHHVFNQVHFHYNHSVISDDVTSDTSTTALDHLQVKLQCCGASGPDDYKFSTWWNHTEHSAGLAVPHTCCTLENTQHQALNVRDTKQCQIDGTVFNQWKQRQKDVGTLTELHKGGCVNIVLEWLGGHSDVFVTLLSISLLLELYAVIAAGLMIRKMKLELNIQWDPVYDNEI